MASGKGLGCELSYLFQIIALNLNLAPTELSNLDAVA
jgi:hypothetical protein